MMAIAQLWWSSKEISEVCWQSWDKLCKHKNERVLGFKELTDFNTVMLGKKIGT